MDYFILILGLALLLINYFRLKKLSGSVTVAHEEVNASSSLWRKYFNPLWIEWRRYALGNGTWKGSKGAITAMIFIVGLLLLNANFLDIDMVLFFPALLLCVFCAQIYIGRSLHRRYFDDRFPEVLAVINASISAGNSIHQALHRCGQSVEGELGEVFNRIDRRLNLGEEPERVFRDAWLDYRYREFYFFVVVMLVSLQRGGQMRVLIGRLSRIITNSKNMARRKAAMTSEARMSAKIVAVIPLFFLLSMKYLSPENFDFIINDPVGRLILYYVIGSEVIGMIIILILVKRAV
ncbi:type II secretion system F family protein [Pectobacterium sp. CHL-2024]|uniref:type II secretion system F family protein n=1 Tax=Pectobacterium TaxID=122277 RepID=UPI000C1C5E43|nr:type II secretion system F family protein [Pectobacterium brasiliense]ATV44425.1 secretion system protein [Pectobacterium brasiliense]MBA0210499.1 type II secretion system F family protein [Pectobacterium brasiliense]MCA6982390.1 type II secretion system F family protein [Pectobacterium brasiliense]MCH4991950.1 type II secretion system F family protein [Pectobacterium brasiliense]